MTTLADVIEKGRRLEAAYICAVDGSPDSEVNACDWALTDFYAEHGPRLLAVAEAAVEWRRAEAAWEAADKEHHRTCVYEPIDFKGCPHADVWAQHDEVAEARAAFDDAAGETR
jgi:hypothetical protein